MSDFNREEDNFFSQETNKSYNQFSINEYINERKKKKEPTSDWKCKKTNKQTNKQSTEYKQDRPHTLTHAVN